MRREMLWLLATVLAIGLLNFLQGRKIIMSQTSAAQALADLQAQATATGNSINAAIALLNSLAAQVAAGQGVSASDIEAVVGTLQGEQASLDSAVATDSPAPAGGSAPAAQVKAAPKPE